MRIGDHADDLEVFGRRTEPAHCDVLAERVFVVEEFLRHFPVDDYEVAVVQPLVG